MKNQRGTASNPIPSQFHPLIERLARLWLKTRGYVFEGGDEIEDLYRSINPVVRDAIAYATATVVELEDWMIDVSGNGLEAFGAFIAGEEGGIPMPHYGQTPEEQLEKNQPAMAWAKTRIDGFNNKESDRT